MNWRIGVIATVVFGYLAYVAYDLQRGGYFQLPDLPDNAYPVSFTNGLRGIVSDSEVSETGYSDSPKLFRRLALANPDRKYLGIPSKVSPWFEDVWSTCKPPTEEERSYLENTLPKDLQTRLAGARFDAVCFIEVDNEQKILRGLLFSVPRA